MEIIFYLILIFIIIILIINYFYTSIRQLIINNKNNHKNENLDISEDMILSVNVLVEKTIDTAVKLYGTKDDIDEFIQFVLKEIRIRIDNSLLSQSDKDYWTHERIENQFTSLIVRSYRKSIK